MSQSFKERKNNLPTDPDKLTANHLKAIKPKAERYDMLVGKGLALRVHPTGRITFRYIYRYDGKQRTVTVGSYPGESLQALRGKYKGMHGQVDQGVDPGAQRRAEKEAKKEARENTRKERSRRKTALRVENLADMFMDYIADPNNHNKKGRPWSPRTQREYRQHLYNKFIPVFGDALVKELEARDVSAWIGKLAVDTPVQANRVLATLRVMFGWAANPNRGYMDTNIAAGIEKPKGETSKTRALNYSPELEEVTNAGEIKQFWNGLENANPLHRLALQMILLTGQRPNEIYTARWEHIIDDDRWVIPKDVTKNRRIHKVPLTPMLMKHFKEIIKFSGDSPFLFPQSRFEEGVLAITKNRQGRDAPVVGTTVSKAIKAHLPDMDPFTPHDLRRTVATHLKSLNVPEAEIGDLLNHTLSGVTAIYARGGGDIEQMRRNLDKWHRRLDKILTGKQSSNVRRLQV